MDWALFLPQFDWLTTYKLDWPQKGRKSIGYSTYFTLSIIDGGVTANDGQTLAAYLGNALIDFDREHEAQAAGFDARASHLGCSLGLERLVTMASDSDDDGTHDIVEFIEGTDPNDVFTSHKAALDHHNK